MCGHQDYQAGHGVSRPRAGAAARKELKGRDGSGVGGVCEAAPVEAKPERVGAACPPVLHT